MYKFLKANGENCCTTDNPKHLCDDCKVRERQTRSNSGAFNEVAALSSNGPTYDPFGVPPDGYTIALSKEVAR